MAFYVICERCGHLVFEKSRRCPSCGSRVEGLRLGERSRRSFYLFATAFVGLLLLVVVVVFLVVSALSERL